MFCAREAALLFIARIPNLQETQHAEETKAPVEESSRSEPQGVASAQSAQSEQSAQSVQSAPAAAALDCHLISLTVANGNHAQSGYGLSRLSMYFYVFLCISMMFYVLSFFW